MGSGCGAGVDISTFSSALWSLGALKQVPGKVENFTHKYNWGPASVKVMTSLLLISSSKKKKKNIYEVESIYLPNVGKPRKYPDCKTYFTLFIF